MVIKLVLASGDSYHDWLKQDLSSLIDALEITDLQKHFLRSRWLDQVLWMEKKSKSAQKQYYLLRLTAIIGGVIVPALLSLSFTNTVTLSYVHGITFVLSLVVAISVAVEEFFHYGERWRHYRSNVELLKIEGWQFFQLSGRYKNLSHVNVYPVFAENVENILQKEVDVYITDVVKETKGKSTENGTI